ncbi:hypothetical protein [Undibacterium sp.]|uniref:hypothetical protein n=1 Tax=Undibacterium sp. TaxID=1914977 RepID=UPI0037531CA8
MEILEADTDLLVVITFTWLENRSFSELVGLLIAQDGEHYAKRFFGTAPNLKSDVAFASGNHECEIER